MAKNPPPGSTQQFVLAQGFGEIAGYPALIGEDNSLRLFAEVLADTDRPDVRPQEAYHNLLASLQPGGELRVLQIFWPDPWARDVFCKQVQTWLEQSHDALNTLQKQLLDYSLQAPLPFARRTILELVASSDELVSWWEGMLGVMQSFGMRLTPLSPDEIKEFSRWIFNPTVE